LNRIESLQFQVEAIQKKYLQELSRRESVRSSLAVPIAILSFAAFGFVALANTAVWLTYSPLTVVLSFGVLLLFGTAVVLLISAVVAIGDFEITSSVPEPYVLEFADTAEVIKKELVEGGTGPKQANNIAVISALGTLSDEYAYCTEELLDENARNLEAQQFVMRRAVPGFGMLILAVALATSLKVADRHLAASSGGQPAASSASVEGR